MPTSTSAPVRIALFGHVSATPAALTKVLGDQGISIEAAADDLAHVDCAIFAINPSAGIDAATIAAWESFNDYLTPRIMVALALPGADLDFDDAVLLANRVFDQMATPYLVLHGDDGTPAALISLSDLTIRNYIHGVAVVSESEPEHKELVSEFAQEYQDLVQTSGDDAFAAGLFFPAIPVNLDNGIGIDVLVSYLSKLK
jgi:hypothetical protein